MSSEALSPQQFEGMSGGVSPGSKARVGKIRVENIRKGMIVKPTVGNFPFERVMGHAFHDPDYPANWDEDPEDPVRMYLIPYSRRFSAHQVEGTHYHILLRKNKGE